MGDGEPAEVGAVVGRGVGRGQRLRGGRSGGGNGGVNAGDRGGGVWRLGCGRDRGGSARRFGGSGVRWLRCGSIWRLGRGSVWRLGCVGDGCIGGRFWGSGGGSVGVGDGEGGEIAAGETDAVAGGGDEQLVARIDVAVVDAAAVAVFVGVYPGHIGDGGGVGMNASVAQAVGAGVVNGVPAEGVVDEGQVGGAWQFDGLRDGGISGGGGGRVERQLREDDEDQQRQEEPKKRAWMVRQPRHNPAFRFVFPSTQVWLGYPRYREVVKFGSVRGLRMVRVADAGQRRKQAESRVLYRLAAVIDDGVVVLHHWIGVIALDAATEAERHAGVGDPQPGDIVMKHLVCLLIERLTRCRVVH